MPTIPALDFVVFYVADLNESVAYFTEKLGFEAMPDQNGTVFRGLKGNEAKIGFGLNVVSADTPPAGTVELYFKTDDLEGQHSKLTANGAGTSPIMHLPFGAIFNVQTPDKHAVVIMTDPS